MTDGQLLADFRHVSCEVSVAQMGYRAELLIALDYRQKRPEAVFY